MNIIKVNMKQFNEKWYDYQDNIKFGDNIRKNNGIINTLDARGYIEWLCEFNIFYTIQ